ncbi:MULTISPECIES: hypothetical protein [unclassified Sphingobacterium]|uniref:hypothetical protein n=1 Tax=unclassified Sphingobacterium TaxID=2609468 RepID=UPI0020C5080F|nr:MULTISPECIES: hypothetical protein [unclassified Sphingobacterium]
MKAITFIILNFLTCVCFSQSHSFMENLERELNPIVHQVLEKDRKHMLIFRLDSLNEVQFYQNNGRNLVDSQQVKLIMQSKKDSLAKNKLYELYFFRDSISDTTFSNYEINEAGTFGVYDIPASYPGGINAFLKVLHTEISANLNKDQIDNYDWNKAISFMVDKSGKLKFIEDNNLIDLVDSTKIKKWQPAIKYGRPVPQYFTSEPINKVKFLFENQYRIELYSYDVLYPSFKGYPIIISDALIKEGNYQTIISFVSAKGFFEPHLIKGTTKNATELINFIKSKGMEHPSFLPHFPGRVYVYYK